MLTVQVLAYTKSQLRVACEILEAYLLRYNSISKAEQGNQQIRAWSAGLFNVTRRSIVVCAAEQLPVSFGLKGAR